MKSRKQTDFNQWLITRILVYNSSVIHGCVIWASARIVENEVGVDQVILTVGVHILTKIVGLES